ncbi:hypothetical protein BC937DRAFT_95590 [Endogone sp. FLAS-F59071]|nr:hypothetical protein BC937DRAFT_95590 [Endogone sp. FLAS-F59071]|eukprot:RUS13269.1 hypothetical protein BC937DRAFT_95590 [Endogone sp. FLAS-F59071]
MLHATEDKLLEDNQITITGSQKDLFIEILKLISEAFDGNIQNNEATSRNYINAFMHSAVRIINQHFKRKLLKLTVENDLFGSLGFGKVDYAFLILLYAILVTEAKALEMPQGIAQNLVQLHTASEKLKRKRNNTPALPAVFGIVSTGRSWRFICWNTSPGKPVVQLSKEYICRFEGEMQDEMNVLQIISTILYIQAKEMVRLVDNDEIEFNEPELVKRIRTSA